MKHNDYKKLNQRYSLSQFRNCPEYLALIYGDADLKEQLQNVIQFLLNFVDIDKSKGFLLDYLAWLIGTSREYFDTTQYFRINAPDVNVEKYIWFSEPSTDFVVPAGSLSDKSFRTKIKAKSAANTSRCTREENIQIIKNMTFADKVIIKNPAPMELDITLRGLNIFITQNLKEDIEKILGNGVGISKLTTEIINDN